MKDPREPHEPTAECAPPLLEAVGVSQHFGAHRAVDEVSLAIAAGEVVGLIGPNGAGKTTLFEILCGGRRPTAGVVRLFGRRVEHRPAESRLAAGLGRTFQIPRPFAGLTVLENVMLGWQGHPGERWWANWWAPGRVAAEERRAYEQAMALIDFVSLTPLARKPAGVLSGGQRKLLELARVLMAKPKAILLDEPAAGVHPTLLETIADRVRALRAQGMTFLIIEHNLDLVVALCDRAIVMDAGKVLCEGAPAQIIRDPRVLEAYVGGALA
jgi:branched-chain amino acid transport system ATP-binding protein